MTRKSKRPTSGGASTLLGAAGEHHVMAQLLRRGAIACLAPTGAPNTDLLVTSIDGERLCAVQVKSRRAKGSDGGWHMRSKHEHGARDSLFYVFVDFGAEPSAQPVCYVIPSARVSDVIAESHRLWLATLGKNGRVRKDGELRRLLPDYDRVGLNFGCGLGWLDEYRENWELLLSCRGGPGSAVK